MFQLKHTLQKTLTGIVLGMLFSARAYGAHPLVTDDSGTQGKGKFQIEINGEYDTDSRNNAGISTVETVGEAAAAITYGITDNIDIVAGMPYLWHNVTDSGITTTHETGNGDMSVELKWKFFDNENSGMSLALKPGFTVPTGSQKKGFGNGAMSGWVMLIATRKGRLGSLHGNLCYCREGYGAQGGNAASATDIFHASMAGELNVSGSLRAVADIGIDANVDKASDTHSAFLLGGLIYSVTENCDLDFGIKCGLDNAFPDHAFLGGLTARF
jgi:hypothetical protein